MRTDEENPLQGKLVGGVVPRKQFLLLLLYGAIATVAWVALAIVLATKGGETTKPVVPPALCDGVTIDPVHGVCGEQYMVSTTNQYATEAALELLAAGGNAFDAAAAAQFVLAVVQPESTGIGGGLISVFYKAAEDRVYALDGREEAPSLFHPNVFCANSSCDTDPSPDCQCNGAIPFAERSLGGHPVGVPGVPAAIERLLADHGSKPLRDVLAPAIRLASQGFAVPSHLYDAVLANVDRLSRFPAAAQLYLNDERTAPKFVTGEVWANPDLAATLDDLATNGLASFYQSPLADEIVQAVTEAVNNVTGKRGVMDVADIAGYRAVYREPINVTYQGLTVYGVPLPSAGCQSLHLMLQYLDELDLGSLDVNGLEYLSRVIDVQDLVFADRLQYFGDPDFVDVPLRGLTNQTYLSDRAAALLRATRSAGAPVPAGIPPADANDGQPVERFAPSENSEKRGTTHLSVADAQGNVVALTTTIEQNLGAAVVVPGRGFLLNNELTDFAALGWGPGGLPVANGPEGGKRPRRTAQDEAERAALGGKRPLSSMTPTLVFRNATPWLALGTPGGSRITGVVLSALLPVVTHGWGLQQAVDHPRVVSRNDFALVEPALYADAALVDRLRRRGFTVTQNISGTLPKSYVQAVQVEPAGPDSPRRVWGAADHTRYDQCTAKGR